jgi:TRAP-type C4-dicarboxylate transport system permease small subunit
MSTTLFVLAAIDRVVYRVSWVLTGIALAVMFLVVMAVIVTRYVVDLPFFWGEELARYAMFYMIMLGSAVALRENGHLRLTLFADMLPPRARRVLEALTDLAVLFVVAMIFWYGLDLAVGDGNMRTPVLRWKFLWIYLAFPISAVLSVLLLAGKQLGPLRVEA